MSVAKRVADELDGELKLVLYANNILFPYVLQCHWERKLATQYGLKT